MPLLFLKRKDFPLHSNQKPIFYTLSALKLQIRYRTNPFHIYPPPVSPKSINKVTLVRRFENSVPLLDFAP